MGTNKLMEKDQLRKLNQIRINKITKKMLIWSLLWAEKRNLMMKEKTLIIIQEKILEKIPMDKKEKNQRKMIEKSLIKLKQFKANNQQLMANQIKMELLEFKQPHLNGIDEYYSLTILNLV